MKSYDRKQIEAVLVTWRCCRRTVYATDVTVGCLVCEDHYALSLGKPVIYSLDEVPA